MNKSGMNPKPDPWRVPITVAQIPESGLTRDIEADSAARDAMAKVAGLRDISVARASFRVTPKSGGRFHVGGHVHARIGQTCVVTLDPVENDIDKEIELIFAPPEQVRSLADLVDQALEADEEVADAPEPIINGLIDLGRLATDALFLGIDPYPRKPDAVFEPPVTPDDPKDHPFAKLKALQSRSKRPRSRKPSKR